MGFEGAGKLLIVAGAVLLFLGLVFILGGRFIPFGRLPGDIVIHRDSFSFYFPLVSFLLISAFLTVVINLILRFLGK